MVMSFSRYPVLNIKKKMLDKIFQKLNHWPKLCEEQILYNNTKTADLFPFNLNNIYNNI